MSGRVHAGTIGTYVNTFQGQANVFHKVGYTSFIDLDGRNKKGVASILTIEGLYGTGKQNKTYGLIGHLFHSGHDFIHTRKDILSLNGGFFYGAMFRKRNYYDGLVNVKSYNPQFGIEVNLNLFRNKFPAYYKNGISYGIQAGYRFDLSRTLWKKDDLSNDTFSLRGFYLSLIFGHFENTMPFIPISE